ncbi:carbohydrate porin [Leptolyngbya sp. FACHB-321]|uniref:iron uptake porin n=1 Tax=Leptolyngbya sp. FACHB-321 TaxID=2692807 RepID=UPI001684C04D|nr:iron uptake porin [Leptolyngbya sp. FACHB-321]MBD2037123.1 carbohydrate porin [Leptolyngbya sp. FACHB-321]
MNYLLHNLLLSSTVLIVSHFGFQSASAVPTRTMDRQAADPSPRLLSQQMADSVAIQDSTDDEPMLQVTSVSQLSDVQPTEWAFQALQSLVERYGCIVGYPDRTFRGNRALTRYEFAAGLNACMDRINELIAAGTADLVKKEDLIVLQRLQEEFAAELATLRGQVGALEAQTATLERQQFSTTTKLTGENVFGIVSVLGGDRADGTEADRIPTFGYRVRLNLETSFSGRDQLTTRFQANNVTPLGGTTVTGIGLGALRTNEGRVEFDGDSRGSVGIGLLRYRFPIGPRTNIYLAGAGNGFVDIDASQQLNPYFDGGAVSLFGLRNSIYNYSGGTGFGLRHLFNDTLELNLGYLVPNANDPSVKNGLFNGQYGALAQLIVNLSPSSRIGFTYVNAYSPFPSKVQPDISSSLGATGSNLANSNFGTAVSTNAFGLSGNINFSPNLALAGWVGYSQQRYVGKGDGDVWNWMIGLAFPDLGRKGDLGGILVGMEPKLTSLTNNVNGGQADRNTSLHVEGFYRFRISDNIAITPGVIWLTAPNHDIRNDDIFIGVLRTVFYF